MKPSSIHFLYLFTVIAVSLFFTSCEVDSPASLAFNSPKATIVSGPAFSFDRDFQDYKVDLTVVNNGSGPTAFNIWYSVKLKRGNYIVDGTSVYVGTLRQNESTSGSAFFGKAKSDADYDHIEAFLYWYDAEGTYYTN